MRPSGWTAVVTAAGHATRFRPFSTIIPKEMLPIGYRPALEHVITECVDAGATTVIVATRPGDLIVSSYLELLRRDGVPVEAVTEDLGHGYGNGAPLLTLRDRLASQETFGIALGDLARIAEVRVHQITGRWVTVGEPRRYFDALRTYWLLQPTPTVAATATDENNRDADRHLQ